MRRSATALLGLLLCCSAIAGALKPGNTPQDALGTTQCGQAVSAAHCTARQ